MKRLFGIVGGAMLLPLFGCTDGEEYLRGLGVPFTVNKIYWTVKDPQGFGNKIMRCNLDGSAVEGLLGFANAPWMKAPEGIALDMVWGRMYWADSNAGRIYFAMLDGSGAEKFVAPANPPLNKPFGVALNVRDHLIYWTERGSGRIRRTDTFSSTLDDADIVDVLTGLSDPTGLALALDPARLPGGVKKIFWLEAASGLIRRANLDGTNIETLVQGQTGAIGIALDLVQGRMYWTVGADVRSATLDGANVTVVSHQLQGLYAPQAIALDLSDAGWNPSNGRKAVTHPAGPNGPCITQSPKANDFSLSYDRIVSNLSGVSTGIAYGWTTK